MRILLIVIFQVLVFLAFSQSESELSLENDSATLSGTLLLPKENPSRSVAIFFSGSGPNDRDGNTKPQFTSNSLKMLAEGLAANGIASLRFDKRGIGKSEFRGEQEDVVFDDFVSDGRAWLKMLKSESQFEQIYVIGHSQGSLVGALVSEDSAVQKFVSIAGVGSSANEIIQSQLEAQSPFMAMAVAPKLDSLKSGFKVSVPQPPLNTLFAESIQPFLISWFAYDPKDVFTNLEKPILIVNGTTDIQVSVAEAEKLNQAAPNAELLIIEGMNHVLKDAPNDRMANIATYSDSLKPLSNGLVDGVVGFLTTE